MGLDLTAVRNGMLAGIRTAVHSGLRLLYPPQCFACGAAVNGPSGLCPSCWRETQFIEGLACDCCGAPLPGTETERVLCDECLADPKPWARGRAALLYAGTGRWLVLAFKHGDRLDLSGTLGDWLSEAGGPILEPGMVVAPIPLHRLRLIRRRYNQSAILAQEVARHAKLGCLVDLFHRTRRTPSQEGRNRIERLVNMAGAIAVAPRHKAAIRGRHVLIVDDVMTSGATLRVATEAALAAGARKVSVLVLARVAQAA